jgi:hypothetical protein
MLPFVVVYFLLQWHWFLFYKRVRAKLAPSSYLPKISRKRSFSQIASKASV